MDKYLLPKIVVSFQHDDITVRLLEPGHFEEDYPVTITTVLCPVKHAVGRSAFIERNTCFANEKA